MRTLEQILVEMDATEATMQELAPLAGSNSSVSFWRFLKKAFAFFGQSFERKLELHLQQVNALLKTQRVGTLDWYVAKAKMFQYGDPLVMVDGQLGYAVIDSSKQIIAQASASEGWASDNSHFLITVKLARLYQGVLQPLVSNQLIAITDYFNRIKFAGVRLDVVSLPPTELRLLLTVEIDSEVLAANGESLAVSNSFPVMDAVRKYTSYLPFNSELLLSKMVDSLQATQGVLDVRVDYAGFKEQHMSQFMEFNRKAISEAGYFTLSSDTAITYIANYGSSPIS